MMQGRPDFLRVILDPKWSVLNLCHNHKRNQESARFQHLTNSPRRNLRDISLKRFRQHIIPALILTTDYLSIWRFISLDPSFTRDRKHVDPLHNESFSMDHHQRHHRKESCGQQQRSLAQVCKLPRQGSNSCQGSLCRSQPGRLQVA